MNIYTNINTQTEHNNRKKKQKTDEEHPKKRNVSLINLAIIEMKIIAKMFRIRKLFW